MEIQCGTQCCRIPFFQGVYDLCMLFIVQAQCFFAGLRFPDADTFPEEFHDQRQQTREQRIFRGTQKKQMEIAIQLPQGIGGLYRFELIAQMTQCSDLCLIYVLDNVRCGTRFQTDPHR